MIVTTLDATQGRAATGEIAHTEFITGQVGQTTPLQGSIRPYQDEEAVVLWAVSEMTVLNNDGRRRLDEAMGEIAMTRSRLLGYGDTGRIDGSRLDARTHFAFSVDLARVGMVTVTQRKGMFGKPKGSKLSAMEVDGDDVTDVLILVPQYRALRTLMEKVKDAKPIADEVVGLVAAARGVSTPRWQDAGELLICEF